MRILTVKYAGMCESCRQELPVGSTASYERSCGLWCVGCAPTDPEAIRALRQEAANRKADRIEGWAEARAKRADAAQRRSDHLMGRDSSPDGRADWALVTQPGHIPQRAQANKVQEKAWQEASIARAHQARANSLRSGVRVAGDAERSREARREKVRSWLAVGVGVESPLWGQGVVTKVNKKTFSMRLKDGRVCQEGIHWAIPCKAATEAQPAANA